MARLREQLPLLLAGVAVLLFLGQANLGMAVARDVAALQEEIKSQGSPGFDGLLLQTSPPGATVKVRVYSASQEWHQYLDRPTPVVLRRSATLGDRQVADLVNSGFPIEIEFTPASTLWNAEIVRPPSGKGWSSLHTELANAVQLSPSMSPVSQIVARPLGTAGVLVGLLAVALGLADYLRRTRAPALPDPGDFVGPGGRIGGYALDEEVGRGAMAEVFLGRPLPPAKPRKLAVKVLHPQVAEHEEFRQRFDREVQICRTLDHPNILKVHDVGEARGRLFLVMDYVPGPSLREALPEEGMDPARARALAVSLAEALAHAHARDIVHRDLKPENVLLAEDGRPLLADFGLARSARYETITATDTTLGTPAYMPPEQVTGHRSGPRADLYSLGCILYEMLTGTPPFQGDAMTVIVQHMTEEPPPPSTRRPGVPGDLEAVVMRLLQKEPDDRYPDAGALLRDLRS